MAAKKAKAAKADPEYTRQERLYFWLQHLWTEHMRHTGVAEGPLADIADECDDILDDSSLPAAGEPSLAWLEATRAAFNALPDNLLRDRFNGFRWRPAPPTPADAREYIARQQGAMQDAVELSTYHTTHECCAFRLAEECGDTSVRVRFPAGTSRSEVLSQLLDILAVVQNDWQTVCDAKIES